VFKVLEPALPGRITTGYSELDNLLLGGLPEKYAIVLTAPSSDESEMLIKRFLRAGAKAGETTFFFTLESENGKALAKEFHSNFYLFIFNPRADGDIMNLHNVVKLNGVGNLSHIDIELTKSLRMLDSSQSRPRRICMEIISDILLQHKAVTTRKWLRGIISELKSNGFTIIAVVNPLMHPPDQVQAILGLFDGEISIFEKDTEEGVENILRVRRMYTQRYLKNELVLLREQLES
jgi:KaiC/GvpD/RAD55 family RecA-like ATPase